MWLFSVSCLKKSLPSYKGSAVQQLLNSEDYKRKICDLLNPQTYTRFSHNATIAVVHKTRELLKESSLELDVKNTALLQGAVPETIWTAKNSQGECASVPSSQHHWFTNVYLEKTSYGTTSANNKLR